MAERKVISAITDDDPEELYKAAANTIKRAIKDILEKRNYAVLAVPGGRTVPKVFEQLKGMDIPWLQVHIFIVDERLVPIDDELSNFRLAKETFIDELIDSGKLPKENAHPFIYKETMPGKGIRAYEKELKVLGDSYDIVLLSAGEDGHVGALYPDHHSIDDDSEFFIRMDDSPKPPKDRMSMSRKLLLRSKTAVLLLIGESKKQAYEKLVDMSISYRKCPAKLVLDIEDSYIITDQKE
ncbi:6-phosphogluconolactonase [Candidatus Woesearchaeota archaeon]|nr:6-phosphogluconolactonase [Candidatus Woesearchaeota archaeon]